MCVCFTSNLELTRQKKKQFPPAKRAVLLVNADILGVKPRARCSVSHGGGQGSVLALAWTLWEGSLSEPAYIVFSLSPSV